MDLPLGMINVQLTGSICAKSGVDIVLLDRTDLVYCLTEQIKYSLLFLEDHNSLENIPLGATDITG